MAITAEAIKADRFAAIVTGQTCGEACWQAREDVCRCSCGGQNHGCDRDGIDRPYRTCQRTIKSSWGGGSRKNTYRLIAVIPAGIEYRDQRRDALKAAEQEAEHELGIEPVIWRRSDDPHLPAFERTATATQRKWAEVAPFAGTREWDAPTLIWKRIA